MPAMPNGTPQTQFSSLSKKKIQSRQPQDDIETEV